MFDLAVIGSGFGGSLLAMIARRLGRSVILLERERHPRFAIGESSTPLANLLLRELASRYRLPQLLPLTHWGDWQRTYPEIGCGLKRGFAFFHHHEGLPFVSEPTHCNQLLVAANIGDNVADTHWYRPDLDHFLARSAQAEGAELEEEVRLDNLTSHPGGWTLSGRQRERPVTFRCQLVIDASGPRGFLHRALALKESTFFAMPATSGLYSHFRNVARLSAVEGFASAGRTPPFPIDDAAVHHVFKGGWIWVLRFNNGVTSAGAAITAPLADRIKLRAGAKAWGRLLAMFPSIQAQFASAEACEPFPLADPLVFRTSPAAGAGWAMLPAAAGFVDPLLSTGFPLNLLGVLRLAEILEHHWDKESLTSRLQSYSDVTLRELDVAAALVGKLYSAMDHFPSFAALSLLYFGASIFSETARRLGRPDLAPAFLLHDHPQFGQALRACLEPAGKTGAFSGLEQAVQRALESIDLGALCPPAVPNWYGVTAADVARADKRFLVTAT